MPKRKDITNIDELLGGKPGASGTTPKATPAAPVPPRSGAPKRAPKAASDQLVSTGQARPAQARDGKALAAEYDRYGQPWAVRLPPALIAELKRIAKREGVNYNALTRWALQQFTTNYKAGRIDLGKAKRPKGYDL